MARKPKAVKSDIAVSAELLTGTPDPLADVRPAILDPEHYPEDDAFLNAEKLLGHPNPQRVPDDAFFADLPEGFVVPKRADYLGDVITKLSEFANDAERVIWLRHNMSASLTYLLRVAFCADVEWLIPTGLPLYKKWSGRRYSSPSELKRELRRFYLFLKGGNDGIADVKRQKLFQQTIEGLESTELGVLVAVKDHTTGADYGLTKELATLAFPGILDAPFSPKFIK